MKSLEELLWKQDAAKPEKAENDVSGRIMAYNCIDICCGWGGKGRILLVNCNANCYAGISGCR